MDIRTGQQRAWENKVAKGFSTTDVQGGVETKIAKNESRVYSRSPNGVLVKDGPEGGA